LLHPLSPRERLAHLGLEGLAATNYLLNAAAQFEKDTILRNEIYRVAINDEHVSSLKQTAIDLPSLTQWVEPDELGSGESEVLGALRLHSGCKLVHPPTYLRGLWSACRSIGSGQREWLVEPDCTSEDYDWEQRLASFDTVVLSAGAGLFQNSIIQDKLLVPVSLVLGQSIELTLGEGTCEHAMMCGKYVSPLLEKKRVLIGKIIIFT
jgi:glycine/D-amino acid oxidase-like deaminating enzyme